MNDTILNTCFIIICVIYGSFSLENLTVQTNVGTIRGLDATDGNYSMFLGIPYAKVNEQNPFGAHIIQPPFTEPFDAIDESKVCPQEDEFSGDPIGTLDCLRLNVYVPRAANASNPLPVLVWIHGGAFTKGYGKRLLYGPKYLVRHDVILVTINYRLGAYGFMCLDIAEVSGNHGLRDQEAALRWVKKNIAAFGGDDNTVTVFGESAGSFSIDIHFRFGDPDLFEKMIMQSGSASSDIAISEGSLDYALRLAQYLNYTAKDSKDAIQFLSTLDPLFLIAASKNFTGSVGPCVEKPFSGIKRFITDYALNVKIPRAKNKPFLLGTNSDEDLRLYINEGPDFYKTLSNIFKTTISRGFTFSEEEMEQIEKNVRQFYIADEDIAIDQMKSIANFGGDFVFVYAAKRSIKEYIENGASNIYHYLFRYSGKRNYMQMLLNVTYDGALHADDLGYLFDNQLLDEPNDEEQTVIDRFTTMWTNFAKYGDPTPQVTDLLPVKWLPVTRDKSYYLDIGKDLVLGTLPYHERMAFLDLFYTHNKNKRKGYKDPYPRKFMMSSYNLFF